jgi:hypothetical protein
LDSLNRYRAFAPPDERDVLTRRIANIERNIASRKDDEPPAPLVTKQAPDPVIQRRRTRVAPQPRTRVTPEPIVEYTPKKARGGGMGAAPITLFAVSGAGAVTGGVFAYRAHVARQAATETCTGESVVYCPSSAAGALRQDQFSSIAADVGFGIAIVSAVTGTWMAVSSKKKLNRTTMSLAPAAGGANLGLSSRF